MLLCECLRPARTDVTRDAYVFDSVGFHRGGAEPRLVEPDRQGGDEEYDHKEKLELFPQFSIGCGVHTDCHRKGGEQAHVHQCVEHNNYDVV